MEYITTFITEYQIIWEIAIPIMGIFFPILGGFLAQKHKAALALVFIGAISLYLALNTFATDILGEETDTASLFASNFIPIIGGFGALILGLSMSGVLTDKDINRRLETSNLTLEQKENEVLRLLSEDYRCILYGSGWVLKKDNDIISVDKGGIIDSLLKKGLMQSDGLLDGYSITLKGLKAVTKSVN